jgi:aspartyl-tRNA(Asn)/glutamyl-tRNA(Gln) amidotransferase subunit C
MSAFMPIDIDIVHVARLARIDLHPDELESYRAQLGVILEHAAKVQAYDTSGVEPISHPLGFTNAFREDEPAPSLPRDEVLSAAPDARDGYFVAPPTMETE